MFPLAQYVSDFSCLSYGHKLIHVASLHGSETVQLLGFSQETEQIKDRQKHKYTHTHKYIYYEELTMIIEAKVSSNIPSERLGFKKAYNEI